MMTGNSASVGANGSHELGAGSRRAIARATRRSGFGAGAGNADLRSTSHGGWCYTEHELFQVFLPLIGPDGGMVYMAMTRLVPLAAVRAELPVTVEALARESCVSRSTAHRKLRELIQLGMVLESKGSSRRPSSYQLVALRELARVGEPELRRRLAELHSQKSVQAGGSSASRSSVPASAQLDLSAAFFPAAASAPAPSEPASEAAFKAALQAGCEAGCETPVSQIDALVSQQSAPVSQPEAAFNPLEEVEKKDRKIPPTPQGGPSGLASVLGASSLGAKPSLCLSALNSAARWVLDESGVSATRRLESMLTRQLQLALRRPSCLPPEGGSRQDGRPAQPTEDALQELALRMVERWRQYLGLCRRQELQIQWGFARFFGEGLWAQPEAWPRRAPGGSPLARQGAAGCTAAAQAERYREPGILRRATGSWDAAGSPASGLDAGRDAGLAAAQRETQLRQAAQREAEQRQAALDYWRRMRQRGVPIYAQEAPLWVRLVLEAELLAPSG